MDECRHEFDVRCEVAVFEDKPGNGAISITANCRHCGTALRFEGCDIGIGNRPMASVDRTELRAPVTFAGTRFSPGPQAVFRIGRGLRPGGDA